MKTFGDKNNSSFGTWNENKPRSQLTDDCPYLDRWFQTWIASWQYYRPETKGPGSASKNVLTFSF